MNIKIDSVNKIKMYFAQQVKKINDLQLNDLKTLEYS